MGMDWEDKSIDKGLYTAPHGKGRGRSAKAGKSTGYGVSPAKGHRKHPGGKRRGR